MNRKRVLLFHNMIAPYRHALFTELAKLVDLRVLYATGVTRDRAWSSEMTGDYDGRVLRSHTLYAFARPLTVCRGLLREVEAYRPEVLVSVLTRSNVLDIVRLSRWCRRSGVPLVLWVGNIPADSDADDVPRAVSGPIDWLFDIALRAASGFICYSELSRRWLELRGVQPEAVAIGTQAFAPPVLGPRLQVGPRPDRFQLLFVGKHERRKGLHVLAEALRSLPACLRTQLSLVTAGDGPLAAELRNSCPPEIDLHMLGFQSPMTLAHLYRNADAMILPSLHDPWGNVANESMALGTPVIASRQCGCRELVEPTGWIVDARDAGSIAAGIATAMNEARSTVRRKAAVASEAGYRPAPAARRMATLIQSL